MDGSAWEPLPTTTALGYGRFCQDGISITDGFVSPHPVQVCVAVRTWRSRKASCRWTASLPPKPATHGDGGDTACPDHLGNAVPGSVSKAILV